MSPRPSNISGCVAARNSVKFGYPLRQCIQALRPICSEVVLAYDPTTGDGTPELAHQLKIEFDLVLFESPWNMDNMKRGFEIGHQSQVAVDACSPSTEWRLCVQQDEAFHEDDHAKIRESVQTLPGHVNGVDFLRPYFYKNLHTIRLDWSRVYLTRLTRKGTHTYDGFDGQNSMPLPSTTPEHAVDPRVWLYHYSRIGDPNLIAKRVRNVDTFFHNEGDLISEEELQPYDFVLREFDSYVKHGGPQPIQTPEGLLVKYLGTHPLPYAKLYQEFE